MKISRDVGRYLSALDEVIDLQVIYDENSQSPDVNKLSAEVEAEVEVERFISRDIEYSDLSLGAQMHVVASSMLDRKREPFLYSELPRWLEMETWSPADGLLILAGVDPHAAIIDWSYENYMGATIDTPIIRHANWFSSTADLYDYPISLDHKYTAKELARMIDSATASGANSREIKILSEELDELQRWNADETSQFKIQVLRLRAEMVGILKRRWDSGEHDSAQRRSPEYFIQWAEKRGFLIEWAVWAREKGYINVAPPASDPPYFDADSEDYPELLHIAVRAWEHAKQTSGGTPKQRISNFVSERYPHVSDGAKEAICLIANWQKSGGRPKTGG
jgi:hypothetical protein